MDKLRTYQQMIADGLAKIPLIGKPDELYEPIRYVLALGGKRMRPVLTLFGCDLFDGPVENALDAALGIELFHNFSLVHDDIMDKAPLRRNQPTVHEKWNPSVAILSGDALLIKAYQQIGKVPLAWQPEVLNVFNDTALLVCEGQQLDMNFENLPQVSIYQYMKMIELKTAALLAGSLQIGAILGSARYEDAMALYEFGRNMGIAFQLQDDILDVYGEKDKFGKRTGGDIVSNKKTFLLLKALEISSHSPYRKEELLQWIHAPEFNPSEKVSAVTAIYDSLDVHALAKKEMNKYYEKALESLAGIPVREDKKSGLLALTNSLMVRET
ncbi:MAG TPA: polyprenyl synthetase family protein [Bacteroidia bacterium]|jgi:geranylgeranyl diphosphate synthase type II|nr:polyprenyl synthetase family protein [Bacteroidia bacterium]